MVQWHSLCLNGLKHFLLSTWLGWCGWIGCSFCLHIATVATSLTVILHESDTGFDYHVNLVIFPPSTSVSFTYVYVRRNEKQQKLEVRARRTEIIFWFEKKVIDVQCPLIFFFLGSWGCTNGWVNYPHWQSKQPGSGKSIKRLNQ